MTNAIDSQLIASPAGSTILWPMIALSNIAQGSSVLAMSVLQKKNERAQQVNVPACISCYLGVTEPALFGVNLKYVFPLVCGMIGSSCAAIVIPFILTMIVGRMKLSNEEKFGKEPAAAVAEPQTENADASGTADSGAASGVKELKSILDGKVIPIDQVQDEVFSQKVMGDGVAIEPANTVVTAPADCDVTVVMADTGHACGLTLSNGLELLIHVGVDTVDMGGDGFKLFVNEGDHVKAGQPLIEFDSEKIKAAGHPCTTMLIVTGEGDASNVTLHSGMDAKAGETAVITWD